MKIVIIDYGAGNILSVKNMLLRLGYQCIISDNRDEIANADKIILPGVGHFAYGMNQLIKSGLVDILNERVIENKIPVLGICLGAQLMCRWSEEGNAHGLAWLPADVVHFNKDKMNGLDMKVPHMGWNAVKVCKSSLLFAENTAELRFYFVHSYHFISDKKDLILSKTLYGYEFISSLESENIFAVQFHPEKSHKYGLDLMKRFINI
jgi:glutamine amidotransferase